MPAGRVFVAETVLITGANSGIGLEFAKQYAARGWTVIATHRRDTTPKELAEFGSAYGSVRLERMDVASLAQVQALAAKLKGEPIDLLINNAGIFSFRDWMKMPDADQQLGSLNYRQFDDFMRTNVRGP